MAFFAKASICSRKMAYCLASIDMFSFVYSCFWKTSFFCVNGIDIWQCTVEEMYNAWCTASIFLSLKVPQSLLTRLTMGVLSWYYAFYLQIYNFCVFDLNLYKSTLTHTHTHIYIYIYISVNTYMTFAFIHDQYQQVFIVYYAMVALWFIQPTHTLNDTKPHGWWCVVQLIINQVGWYRLDHWNCSVGVNGRSYIMDVTCSAKSGRSF